MNFEHTEDRRMLADTLNRFIAEQYAFETRDRIAKSAHGFSPEIWSRFAELGVIGALFREEDGGFGGGGFDIAVVFEALGRGLVVEPFLARGAGRRRDRRGRQRRAEGAARRDHRAAAPIAAFAHDEPGAHYELARVRPAPSARATAGCSTAPRPWCSRASRRTCSSSPRAPRATCGRRSRHLAVPGAGERTRASRCAAIRSSTAAARRN